MENIQKDNILCQICGEVAINICFECVMYLCDSCFKLIHDKTKTNNHKKESIDYFIPFSLKCQEHPKDRINLFCTDKKDKLIFLFKSIFYRIILFNLLL